MSSLGSHTLATLLAELALKRQFGKDSRRGKQENDGLHNETGEACPKGKAGKLRAARHSACRDCLQAATRQGFPLPQVFSRFSPLREKAKIGCTPHQSTPLTASPQGEALTKARITLFAEKMKFTEFFSGKGKPPARIILLCGRLRRRTYPLRR